jgi:hypothetical protein
MNQKEILTIGIIAAFVFASPIAVKPVAAQNSEAQNTDDDAVGQENSAKIAQDAENDIVISGFGNTATTSSTQAAAAVQSNTNTDNDVQVSSADSCLVVC